ncbi:hypothetical protein SMC3_06875 [Candidatus Cryosericum hinesii]|jgi:hypothetical protein|uniref:Uncharacterized protein n=2 Tax=Candidatus Cryosericum TaxID=2498709 RepID=A0A398DMU7_9BACT|nr:hypothetical protein [Candidatus Cryosericum hinesii]RIE11483.1 hypothetical protein SMC2_08755 [Candidatus Cryosericum hinesii]RIE12111.1 hypothetical protein SMC3_06875 [Candidatus Cryosericum hinesii]
MTTTKSRICSTTAAFLTVLLAIVLLAGCKPRTVGTVDVPVEVDLETQLLNGGALYGDSIPAFIQNGTTPDTTDFSATVKVMSIEGTRTIRGEITSPTDLWSQDPEHATVVFYLCQPLSSKANKLSDGSIVYGGDGYPKIVAGQSYDVIGVLQPGWQDYPYVYVPSALEFKQACVETAAQTAADASNKQILMTAARSFADQAETTKGYHATADPVITFRSKQIQAGKMEVRMGISIMDAPDNGSPDAEPMVAGELQYLHDHATTLSAASRKAVEDDIADWRRSVNSAVTTSAEVLYMIKVAADVDAAGIINVNTLQVYADEGTQARPSDFVPAATFLDDVRSIRATVAQASTKAEFLASAASERSDDNLTSYENVELFTPDGMTLRYRALDWRNKNDTTGKVWRTIDASLGTLDAANPSAIQYCGGFAYFTLRDDVSHIYSCSQTSKPTVVLTVAGSIGMFSISPDRRFAAVAMKKAGSASPGWAKTLDLWSLEDKKIISTIKADDRTGYYDLSPEWGDQGWWVVAHMSQSQSPVLTYIFTSYTHFMPAASGFVQASFDSNSPDHVSVTRYEAKTAIPLENEAGNIGVAFDPTTNTVAYGSWDNLLDAGTVAPKLFLYDIITGNTHGIGSLPLTTLPPVWIGPDALEYSTTLGLRGTSTSNWVTLYNVLKPR